MKTNVIARHYGSLTPEERFRLILAAGARGDEAEQDRLAAAGQRLTLSVHDHAPFGHAFDELALLTFIELLDGAADYLESFHWDDEDEDDGGEESVGGNRDDEGAEGNDTQAELGEEDAAETAPSQYEQPTWLRYRDLSLVKGFLLKTHAAGWKLFCVRLTVPPFAVWEGLPGFKRLQRALQLAEHAAFTPKGVLAWVNAKRPAGTPEVKEQDLATPEEYAEQLETLFRRRVHWWGG
jgi:hypothetical protein